MIQEERMKRILLVALCLSLFISLVYAQEMKPGPNKAMDAPHLKTRPVTSSRTAPTYTFTKTPTALMTSYYDYMIKLQRHSHPGYSGCCRRWLFPYLPWSTYRHRSASCFLRLSGCSGQRDQQQRNYLCGES